MPIEIVEYSIYVFDTGRICVPFIRVIPKEGNARPILNLSTLHIVSAHITSGSQE